MKNKGRVVLVELARRECQRCQGKGWVTGDKRAERCPACGGSGWTNAEETLAWLRSQLAAIREQ